MKKETLKIFVEKRNGVLVDYSEDKVVSAFLKAFPQDTVLDVTPVYGDIYSDILHFLSENDVDTIHVEVIQNIVERNLMVHGYYDEAKEYILYRDKRNQERKRDIFKPRTTFKPFEYPEVIHFAEAITQSYWTVDEYNFTSDVATYHNALSDKERNLLRKAMLTISQIEVAVKKFWGTIGDYLPKPEIDGVGAVFSDSEFRHALAYSKLLEVLGMNDEFEKIKDIPALNNRVRTLQKVMNYDKSDKQGFVKALFMFSVLIEHVSLFMPFYIMQAPKRHGYPLEGISNVVAATSVEENIHGDFGIYLIKQIRLEHPELFDEAFEKEMQDNLAEFMASDEVLLDWFFEDGDTFITRDELYWFNVSRLNNSVSQLMDFHIDIPKEYQEKFAWFDEKLRMSRDVDFFVQRDTAYTKRSKPITADDLF